MSTTSTMTSNQYSTVRGGDRSERSSFMHPPTSSGLMSGLQPSLLGFVAKQEMPLHLSILFRAR